MLALFFALLLIVILLTSWGLTLLGLPGNWLMVVVTAVYAYSVPAQSRASLGWKVVVTLLVLAVLGEIVELLAAAAGTARAGGSRRGAALALLGSLLGAVLGLFVGTPVPVVGSIAASLLLAGLGAMGGAILGEVWAGRNLDASWRVGQRAFWGRLLGTLGKMLLGAVMVALVVAALIW
jgi:uncharacterized protein YqgC (DUF456 family)